MVRVLEEKNIFTGTDVLEFNPTAMDVFKEDFSNSNTDELIQHLEDIVKRLKDFTESR